MIYSYFKESTLQVKRNAKFSTSYAKGYHFLIEGICFVQYSRGPGGMGGKERTLLPLKILP